MSTLAMTQFWSGRKLTGKNTVSLSETPEWLQSAYASVFRDLVMDRLREFLFAPGPERSLRKVVDLGCGPGDWSLRFLDFADSVIGVDVNGHFLQVARQAVQAHAAAKQAVFVQENILEFADYQAADLVCLGACVQYLADEDLDLLLSRLADKMPDGACVYLRTTTSHPLRKPYRSSIGHYRAGDDYERRFFRHGFRIARHFLSSQVIPERVARDLCGGKNFLGKILWWPVRLVDLARWHNDHMNWILVKERR